MQKKITILTGLLLMILQVAAQSQHRAVTGRVTHADHGTALSGVKVTIKGTQRGTVTGHNGKYRIYVSSNSTELIFAHPQMKLRTITVGKRTIVDIALKPLGSATDDKIEEKRDEIAYEETEHIIPSQQPLNRSRKMKVRGSASIPRYATREQQPDYNTEGYDRIYENTFLRAIKEPLSTFSIDVDAASYSNVRRFLSQGQQPPKDAVRIEEMVNYFHYDYPQPKGEHPFSITTEISSAPWNDQHRLVHIGLQGKKIATEKLPASNLVFLIDVSGSMNAANKLPLLKSAFTLLVEELRPEDHVALVVYAGAAGLVLPATPGNQKEKILTALNRLQAGGSTAGGAGLELAYKVAGEHFVDGGNNRVILATDGDFNIGASSNAAMERLISEKRKSGISLTALGFGMGNYQDSKMEILADKGDGNYAYIDNILEAKKVLVSEFGGTLFTIAKDVKLQVEFNPAKVQAYRLIGYENRVLKNEDFNNDKKDAGELGSGHTVTALYEIIPVGVESKFAQVGDLKYQHTNILKQSYTSKELMAVKFRYKKPEGGASRLMVHPLHDTAVSLTKSSKDFRWSAAVAGFGMLLRDSEFKGTLTLAQVLTLAESAQGKDEEGYRSEFIRLLKSQELLVKK